MCSVRLRRGEGGARQGGPQAELAEITMKPTVENALSGDEAARMRRLLDALEALDDVQDVYTTAVVD